MLSPVHNSMTNPPDSRKLQPEKFSNNRKINNIDSLTHISK